MEETKDKGEPEETPNEEDNLENILSGGADDQEDASIFELKVTLDSLITPMSKVVGN